MSKLLFEKHILSGNEEYMCNAHLEYFEDKLLSWKQELQVENIDASEILQNKYQYADQCEKASVENHMTLQLRTKSRDNKLIDKINISLKKIKNKDYGYCEMTGEPIGLKRLNARPIAVLSIAAQEIHESFEKNHNKVI